MNTQFRKPLTVAGGAIAGGLIAGGVMMQVIPLIGTGTGTAAIISGLAVLGGGTLASGGMGVMGGIGVLGTIITSSGASGGAIASAIQEQREKTRKNKSSRELIMVLSRYIPNITNTDDTPDEQIIMAKYRLMNNDIVWLHVNEGYPYIDDSIVITNNKLTHIIEGKIVVECNITNIVHSSHTETPFFRWNILKLITNEGKNEIPVKQKGVIDTMIKVLNILKKQC